MSKENLLKELQDKFFIHNGELSVKKYDELEQLFSQAIDQTREETIREV